MFSLMRSLLALAYAMSLQDISFVSGSIFRLAAAQHSMGLSAVQARYENAYVHCLAVLKGLYDSAQSSGVLPDMSPAERKKALQTFLRVPFTLHLYVEAIQHLTFFQIPFCSNGRAFALG